MELTLRITWLNTKLKTSLCRRRKLKFKSFKLRKKPRSTKNSFFSRNLKKMMTMKKRRSLKTTITKNIKQLEKSSLLSERNKLKTSKKSLKKEMKSKSHFPN